MSESVLVTVMCTCFNHEKYVIESIQSVLNQNYTTIQLIVVDDYSSDNSTFVIQEFIKNHPEIIFIKNNSNLGVTKSFNNAMRFAKGSYFVDLAADDVLLSNCIELQLNTFKNSIHKNLAIVYGNAEIISENGSHSSYYFDVDKDLRVIQKQKSGNLYSDIIGMETVICSVSALYKKSVFDSLLGYDETLEYEDFDYWIRISRNYDIEFVDEILVQKRILTTSLYSSFLKNHSKIGNSTFRILKNASHLNTSKKEHAILKGRVFQEIKSAIKTVNFILLCKNCWLWLLLKLKSV
jgi:glycosyltransferase involved in cell wall biosynthesis